MKNNILEEIFVQIYNSIIANKHKTKDKLLNAIKDTITNTDCKVKIDKLNSEKIVLEKRLSNLIDMKLDNYEHKEIYNSKEKELNDKIFKIVNEINEYRLLEQENKDIATQLQQIEDMINVPLSLKEFDREAFDSIVEKVIVGEVDEYGNINPNILRFVLKVGSEYKYDLNNNGNGNVSFDSSYRSNSS